LFLLTIFADKIGMTELNQIFKCNVCGNIAEVVHSGAGELVCCGQPMELQQEKTEEEGIEKHKPVVERTETGVIVTIGSTPHPMESEHYIEWAEVITEHRSYRKHLKPGQEPQAQFSLQAKNITVRAYCNVHGLWKS
jgi:superoxide reductase